MAISKSAANGFILYCSNIRLGDLVMKVLVACEESQAVCKAFRKMGHEAYSCDIQDCSGGRPEWHLKEDVLGVIKREKWDMIIAFPPCTYLTNTANVWLRHPDDAASKNGGVVKPLNECRPHPKHPRRREQREDAAKFFLEIAKSDCPRICIENPIGYMNENQWMLENFTKPPVMHPYHFGDPVRKATMFWVKGLPVLKETNNVKHLVKLVKYESKSGKKITFDESYLKGVKRSKAGESSVERSKTYNGVALAMAQQWGSL